jgi:hypothetical protein
MGQKFYADPNHTFAFTNGAVGYRSGATFDVLGPYAKVRNCPVVAYGAERARLTCYATGYADTYFSVPACTRFRGRYVRGYFAVENDMIEFRVMNSHRDLFIGVELQARRSVIQVAPVDGRVLCSECNGDDDYGPCETCHGMRSLEAQS